jgi:hypothetical protein
MTEPRSTPVHICGHALGSPRHVCCFFDTMDQRYEALLPTLQEGLQQDEEVICITESALVAEHRARLHAHGIQVDAYEASGQLSTLDADSTYLQGGRFDKDRMYGILESCLERVGPARRYRGVRTCGDMAWALQNFPGTDQLMEYESEVNRLLTGRDDITFICIYDANRISGKAMLDLLSTHSHVIIGTDVHANPYHMSPDEYRRTFLVDRARSSPRAG